MSKLALEPPLDRDCRGVKIKVGDLIVYPVRRKSTMVLKQATVYERPGSGTTVKKGIVALNPEGKRVTISRADRCAVVSDFSQRNNKGD
jgi:hypothetical protein